MRTIIWIKTYIFWIVLCFMIHTGLNAQQENPEKQYQIHLSGGLRHSAERDNAFSDLVYTGWMPSIMGGFEIKKSKKTEMFLINYVSGTIDNHYGNAAKSSNISFFNYTLYHQWKILNGKMVFGWSNNNNLTLIDFDEAVNFTPRFSYLTNVGATARFQHRFGDGLSGFSLEAIGYIQLIGFKTQSSYVSAAPSGYEDNYESGISAYWNSTTLFYPFHNWNWGIWPSLRYTFKSGNSIHLTYRYDMLSLEDTHRLSTSTGNYLITITTVL